MVLDEKGPQGGTEVLLLVAGGNQYGDQGRGVVRRGWPVPRGRTGIEKQHRLANLGHPDQDGAPQRRRNAQPGREECRCQSLHCA